MMKRNDFSRMLFGLDDASVQFRNRWRGIAGATVWLVLSGISVGLGLIGVADNTHKAIVIGLGLVKYIPMLMVVYSLSKQMAGRYLDDVYELHNEEMAADFLEEVTFGYGHQRITIKDGRISEEDEKSSLILIGGPGEIQVNLDSVALLEKVNGEPEVIHPRSQSWKLGRFERIREIGRFDEVGKREYAILNLRDQFISGLTVRSRTKDGIPLEAHGIKLMFSILRKDQAETEATQGDAYLFEESAVRSILYNQTIISPAPTGGANFPWDTTVIPLVLTELEHLITSHTLSEILATISQKEMEITSTNEQTIAQMRVEMTGQMPLTGQSRPHSAPSFKSRTQITAQFYEKAFKEKAARLGVSIHWIDIGNWQLPNTLILDKHKEAWNLARENARKRAAVENSARQFELRELVALLNNTVISIYENGLGLRAYVQRDTSKRTEGETSVSFGTDLQKQSANSRDFGRRDARSIAFDMLKAFRKELIAGRSKLEADNRPLEDKQEEIERIDKALFNINQLTKHHWIQPS